MLIHMKITYIKEEFIMYGDWMKDMPIVVGSESKDKKIK